MGYSTNFEWKLKFKKDLTVEALALLNTMMWEDARDHPEWEWRENLTWMDLRITDDFTWIEWNGSEKTYDLERKVALVIRLMREKYPDFWLEWDFLAKWEDREDVWRLIVTNDKVEVKELKVEGIIECPECECRFVPWED